MNDYLWNNILSYYQHPVGKIIDDNLIHAHHLMEDDEYTTYYDCFRRMLKYRNKHWRRSKFHKHKCRQQIIWNLDKSKIIVIFVDGKDITSVRHKWYNEDSFLEAEELPEEDI